MNKQGRLFLALLPIIGSICIWGAWELKMSPKLDFVYETETVLIEFHEEMDNKIAAGELSKDEAIYIYKRNALRGKEADEEVVELFKSALSFLFLSLSLCILVTSIRVVFLEIKSDWKL